MERPLVEGGHPLVPVGQGASSPGGSIWDGGADSGFEVLLHMAELPVAGPGLAGTRGVAGESISSDHSVGDDSRSGRDDGGEVDPSDAQLFVGEKETGTGSGNGWISV